MKSRTYTIGRQGDIPLNDDTVGRRHAELIVTDTTYYLTDLGSLNGTEQIKDGRRFPFKQGYVHVDDEFAFGECIKSIAELLALGKPAAGAGGVIGSGSNDADAVDKLSLAQKTGLDAGKPTPLRHADETASGQRIRCPGCGAVILVHSQNCPECGEEID